MKTLWSKFWFRWVVWLGVILLVGLATAQIIIHSWLPGMIILVSAGIGLIAWDIARVTK